MLLAKKDKDEQVLLDKDQAWMESKASSSSIDEKISEISYYLSESESESEFETSKYYDNSTNYGFFVNNDDDQEFFHDAIEFASENFIENHIDSQKDYDKSDVDHNDSEEKNHLVDKLIRKFNKKIVKCQKRIKKANQQSKDFKNQNKDLQDKYDVLKYQATTLEMNNKELNEQLKELIEKNNDLLAQTKKHIANQEVLYDKMSVQFVALDKHVRDLKNTVLEKDFKISELEECVRNKDLEIEKCLKRLNDCGNKLHKMGQTNQTVHMIMPSKDNLYNGQQGIGFENPSYFEKAKDLRPMLYDEKGNLNASYVNEKINFEDDYFQEIVNPYFDKIDSSFQQTSSLKPYVLNVILEKIIIDLEDEVVNLLEKEKANLETIESLKSKRFESSETAISESENQSENDCLVVKNEYEKEENSKVIAPGMFKLNLDTFSSVRRPKNSDVNWKKKGSSNTSKVDLSAVSHSKLNKNVKRFSRKDLLACNNSHLIETSSAYVRNDAMNVSCNPRMCDLLDDNNFFIFDDESVRISPVSKMPFKKKPCDSMNVCSKSNMIKYLPRTVCKWLPKMQPLAKPVAKWFPRVKRQIDKISKIPNSSGTIYKWVPKHMTGNHALLTNLMEKFLRTVRFGNNDFAVIAGYGDVVISSMTIKKVYYVKGLGHNLFSVGQFCDKGLEVAFRKSTCFVQNEDGVDLLIGDRSSNLYTIALNEFALNSLTCLLAKASSSQSWLWHQRLSHLNFATMNNLVKNNLVQGLPKMKFEKDHLCSACEQGKIHQKHHKSKTTFASNKPLYLLHMDLCGPMRVQSLNRKRYVLVVVDDYSWYTWVIFLHSKDEASERNRTLVEAARTMLTFTILPLFLWAEAIATACFTQNRSIFHKRFDKTPYELMNKRKPNIKFFRVFGCGCYLLNNYEDVRKLKVKGDIGVFVGYSKESASFRIYNKRTRKIHESMNVNFDEISKMASKQFSLEPGLSKLNETGKSSNQPVSQVSKASRKDLEDLFQDFYDEYLYSSKFMKSSTTNVETPINEEVFHEIFESFQGEYSSFSLNDDVQQSLEEVILPQTNTQSISNNMIPN
nr:hypothetical protein [Tanacetum cinerariifolium]